jgi:hypothetical protein
MTDATLLPFDLPAVERKKLTVEEPVFRCWPASAA